MHYIFPRVTYILNRAAVQTPHSTPESAIMIVHRKREARVRDTSPPRHGSRTLLSREKEGKSSPLFALKFSGPFQNHTLDMLNRAVPGLNSSILCEHTPTRVSVDTTCPNRPERYLASLRVVSESG